MLKPVVREPFSYTEKFWLNLPDVDTAHPPFAARRRRVPAFHPVPRRRRVDGWTALRRAEFIGWLVQTRSVSAAARAVGMARGTAYRLRRQPGAESFAAARDAVLGAGRVPAGYALRKVTPPGLHERIETGRVCPVMRRGRFLGVVRKAYNSALLALVAQLARAEGRARQTTKGHDINSAEKCHTAIVKLHAAPVRTCRTRQSV